MIINEIIKPEKIGYYNADEDQTTEYSLRRSRLTLKQINKLRKMNDVRRYEEKQELELIQRMYGISSKEEGSIL